MCPARSPATSSSPTPTLPRSTRTVGSARATSVSSTTTAYLRIVGRSKELIISGGFNVYPREIEDVLRDHPSVRDVAVVGTPSDEWGEIVTAFIETDDETLDTEALSSWAASRLVRYKQPRHLPSRRGTSSQQARQGGARRTRHARVLNSRAAPGSRRPPFHEAARTAHRSGPNEGQCGPRVASRDLRRR